MRGETPAGVRPRNVGTLREVLTVATREGFGVGAFSARYVPMVRPIVRAAQRLKGPAIVQISQNELTRYGSRPAETAAEFFAAVREEGITVPLVLHLDHTGEMGVIEEAIAAGFTSVMIDASDLPLEENIALTRRVVDYAQRHGVSVEAELGRIGTTDYVETERDEELYTDPDDAARFVRETEVDALAVSVGTAHGVYTVRQPRIDIGRLEAIRRRTAVPLVLHGGSGVPADMMQRAIGVTGGGVSKVNIATDLELAFLGAIGRTERLTNSESLALPPEDLAAARAAVESVVAQKMRSFVRSEGRATDITESAPTTHDLTGLQSAG